MPAFILVRTREWFVPPVAKSDAMSLTLTSITVSLAFVPVWLAAAPDLLDVRHRLTTAAAAASAPSVPLGHRGVVAFFALSLLLPVSVYSRPLPTGKTGIQNLGAAYCRDSASPLLVVASAR